ncbi:MAG: hypothetical protein HYT87_13520 [Nitrospirae bacterium]|nr:hypothetical protein [Nitrospirota bacterium]
MMGLWSALAAEKQLRAGGNPFAKKYFWWPFAATAVFFLPLGFYLAYRFSDWSLMYYVEPPSGNTLFSLFVACVYAGAFAGGYRFGLSKVRLGQVKWGRVMVGLIAAGIGIFCLATWNRLMNIGTMAEYQAGAGRPFAEVMGLLVPNVIVGSIYGALMFLALAHFHREGRRPSRPVGSAGAPA